MTDRKSYLLLFCGLGFCFGGCGLHRLYDGKYVTGYLWLLTFGLAGVGQLIDLALIIKNED